MESRTQTRALILALVACLATSGVANASEWWCDTAYLRLADCSELAATAEGFIWPAGESLAVRAGECTGCPTPGPPDQGPYECDISDPSISVLSGDTYIETEWERVAPTETMCGLLSVLSTPLEPGDYVIEVNGNEQWTVRLEGAGIGPVPTGEEGGSSAADSGCAASATGPHSRSLPILSWLLIAAGLCLLGRRRSRALS